MHDSVDVEARMGPLLAEAMATGKWLECRCLDVCFSPDELRREWAAGEHDFGPANWELIDPAARLSDLEGRVEEARRAVEDFRSRMAVATAGAAEISP